MSLRFFFSFALRFCPVARDSSNLRISGDALALGANAIAKHDLAHRLRDSSAKGTATFETWPTTGLAA
jgi:hypothetical protein